MKYDPSNLLKLGGLMSHVFVSSIHFGSLNLAYLKDYPVQLLTQFILNPSPTPTPQYQNIVYLKVRLICVCYVIFSHDKEKTFIRYLNNFDKQST